MESAVVLFEDYQEYMNDIAEEAIYRTRMRVPSKNFSDTGLKNQITKECRNYCSSYLNSDVFPDSIHEKIEALEEQINSGNLTREGKDEFIITVRNLSRNYLSYLSGFKRHIMSISRNGYDEYAARLNHSDDRIPTKISKELYPLAEECYDNFDKKIDEIIDEVRNIDIAAQVPAQPIYSTSSVEISEKRYAREDKGFLEQYLKDVYTVEMKKYCAQQAIEKMEREMPRIGQDRQTVNFAEYNSIGAAIKGVIFSVVLAVVYMIVTGNDLAIASILVSAIIGFAVAFSLEYKTYKTKEQECELLREEQEKKHLNELKRLEKYKKREQPFFDIIASCDRTLNKLYDMDVIFVKYRDLVSVAQLYEYIASGRCEKLEGHEGAYNLFENELRLNIIISQLNVIINQLEDIKRNQMMIYSAIQESNSLLAQISNNTAITAYNTSVIANNTMIGNRYY